MNRLVVWGAGGHGKVVLDVARSTGKFRLIEFIDDDRARSGSTFCECPVLGGPEQLEHLAGHGFVIAVGDNHQRSRCYARARANGLVPLVLVHKTAIIAPSAIIGPGTVVTPGAIVNAGAIIGENCIINTAAIVEHDCLIGDHVHISPRVALGGAVTVHRYAHVGIGAVVLPGGTIGEAAVVGAGAVVLKGVSAESTVIGVPARVLVHA